MLYYLTGLHFGFFKSLYPMSMSVFLFFILPIGTIIVSIEIIRKILLSQNNKIVNVLIFISSMIVDILIFGTINDIKSFNYFMDFFGLTLIPAITSNILYHYLSKRYGIYPNIVYRLLITLYPYIIPYVPSTPDSLVSFCKLIIPLIIYYFIDSLYETKKQFATHKKSKLSYIGTGFFVVAMISIVMIISGQFKYSVIVIGSESMSGELNKGDIALYEKYDGQTIEEGQIIIFEKNNKNVIHRVIEIKQINGETRYYTKGDANEGMDDGYIVQSQIVGITNFKIAYLGYPTIWIRDIFN